MKKITSQLLLATTLIIISITSCKKDFLEEINNNPNEPALVKPNVLLPAAQASLAYTVGGDGQRIASIFAEYVSGANRQMYSYNRYIMTEEDFNNFWNGMYAGNMYDLKKIMNYAAEHPGEFDNYDACARILMAYALGTMTDFFGDIPYTQAFQGLDNRHPAFDTQQSIYQIIDALLDQAVVLIDNEIVDEDDLSSPVAEDFFYTGDMLSWRALAYGLKARAAIHLTNLDPITASQNALAAIANGALISNSGDARFRFGGAYQAPWFQFNDQRTDISYSAGDAIYGVGNYCIDSLMVPMNDPRYGVYIDINGDDPYWEIPGFLGTYFNSDNSSIFFFQYFEQKFIEAEAYNRLGMDSLADAALYDAVVASMTKVGVDISDSTVQVWLSANAHANDTTPAGNLKIIMTQKYIAMYLQTEGWTDVRRTGIPVLPVNAGVLTQIPRRFIYGTEERQNNAANCPQNSTLLVPPLWWD